jgi:uncharacterized protein YecA (UPF0149 family)
VGLSADDFVGTRVNNGSGLHRVADQRILDKAFGSFLIDRAAIVERLMNDGLSQSQKMLVEAEVERLGPKFFETELWKATAADAGLLPGWSKADVGRNESCPCGSGRKFKRCHGR